MYKAIILPLAQQDIKEAAAWYNERQPGLGKRFTQQVRKKIGFIRKHPNAVAIRYDDIRTLMLDVFPYLIHYAVDKQNEVVIISAIFSTHRDPDIWSKR